MKTLQCHFFFHGEALDVFGILFIGINAFQVPASINCRLLEHQRVGVKFLYSLYKNNHGGILGDDM